MFLHEVTAEEFKGFNRIEIRFDKHFTILSGPNGVGKSTVLFAIASAITISSGQIPLNENSQCKIRFTDRNSADKLSGFGKKSYKMSSLRHSNFQGGPRPYIFEDGRSEYLYDNDIAQLFSPLFIGPNRNIFYQQISGMTAERSCVEYRSEYLNKSFTSLANGYTPEIKQWMINRYFITDKDWAGNEKKNWEFIISNLDFIFGSDGRFFFDKIGRDLEPLFLLDDSPVYLEDLSSGFKSVLSIVLSIVEWIEKTNENENMLIENARGVVLIDELDAHLHPAWQTKIKNILIKLFPKLQFIVTSHSPHVISSADAEEVIVLRREHGEMKYTTIDKSLAAWKTDDIYSLIMGVDTVHQITLKDVVNKVDGLVENGRFDEALSLIDEYSEKTPSTDPTAMVLKHRINSLMVAREKKDND
jgi:ABC-type cobalamin/Fe3+-siderophores transport system ATPase subunit